MIPRYYLPKLFGGSRNAQRIITNPSSAYIQAVKGPKPLPFFTFQDEQILFETDTYTRREFGGPQGTVVFYADQRLTDSEASERLWRYLMQASKSKLVA